MNTYTSKQIAEDFKYLVKNLEEIHPNPFLFTSKKHLEKALDNLALRSEDAEEITLNINHLNKIITTVSLFTKSGLCGMKV